MATSQALLSLQTRARIRFLFTKALCSLYQQIGINVSREVCSYLGAEAFLAVPEENRMILHVWDLETKKCWMLKTNVEFRAGTSFCLMGMSLLIVTNVRNSSTVSKVSLLDGETTSEGRLLTPRGWCALVFHLGYLWVFGGSYYRSLASSEKFSPFFHSSTALPSMPTPKAHFSAVLSGEEIYLPDVSTLVKRLEVFHIEKEEYRSLEVLLLDTRLGSVTIMAEGRMVVFTYAGTVGTWSVGSSETELKVKGKTRVQLDELWRSQPQRLGNSIFFARTDGTYSQLDLKEFLK